MAVTLPDYAGGSIVNLMATIQHALGGPPSVYPPLRDCPAGVLDNARSTVLLVVDGLGYDFLHTVGQGSTLHSHVYDRITSVFPSTTAAAIPVFLTGAAPQQHALTGWHIYFDEIAQCLAVLPLTTRGSAAPVAGLDPARLFTAPPLWPRLPLECALYLPAHIVDSAFNRWHGAGAQRHGYRNASQLFELLQRHIRAPGPRRFVYAYYAELDACAHHDGPDSRRLVRAFEAFDTEFAHFLRSAAGTDTAVVVTADHGFIDAPRTRLTEIDSRSAFAGLLAHPLCGERRVAYCYVAPDRTDRFEAYVAEHLGECADLHRSRDLLAAGWFGPGPAAPALAARIGDYTLVMRDRYTIKDWMPGEPRHHVRGVHGGVSAAEMMVPLIFARV
jgi:hypothetical protein